ncbi:hypothetical protein LEN26_019480 [Aphanomyces euteiches]|nr:hypothetical protein LEN26_019480 [Aphanomyces euteiches]KAH9103813.1 hypothetical protein AeMF1_019951 [Aphanomyces euteiches]
MKTTAFVVAAVASSVSATQCTTAQISPVTQAVQNSANAIPCTSKATFSFSEFISNPDLLPSETQVATAAKNANCKALVTELQSLTISANCEWWGVPLKTLLQYNLDAWVTTKQAYLSSATDAPSTTPAPTDGSGSGDTPEPTTTKPKTTTAAPNTTKAANTTTVAPTTTIVVTTTQAPTNSTNNTNTTLPTTAVITVAPETDAPFVTDPETPEPTLATTTRAPTTTKAPSSASHIACSIAAVLVVATATLL